MPTAKLGSKGPIFFYEDSGAPYGATEYTTVVFLHGLMFQGAVFRPLLPYAAQHTLRLVFLNQRDYSGSSRYSDEELQYFQSSDSAPRAVRDRGHELALFLKLYAHENDIPRICAGPKGKKEGGISIVAWSLGNATMLSMVSHVDTYSEATKTFLDQYIRAFVIYDAASSVLGIEGAVPSPGSAPARSLSIEEQGHYFASLTSQYFPQIANLASVTPSFLEARVARYTSSLNDGTLPAPTSGKMSRGELASIVDFNALPRSYQSTWCIPREIWYNITHNALFNTCGTLPRAKAVVIWCDMSMNECVWAAKYIQTMTQAIREGQDLSEESCMRHIDVVKVENGNHFVHWENPERFLAIIAQNV